MDGHLRAFFAKEHKRPGNECCFECGVQDPSWASVSFGMYSNLGHFVMSHDVRNKNTFSIQSVIMFYRNAENLVDRDLVTRHSRFVVSLIS